MIVRVNEDPGTLDLSSVEVMAPIEIDLAINKEDKKVVYSLAGVSFFSSGFAASFFVEIVQENPPPAVPPIPPEKTPAVWGTGVDVPDVSSFWVLPDNLPPNPGRRRGRRRSGSTVCWFGGSPKNPPSVGTAIVVVADEPPTGLGGHQKIHWLSWPDVAAGGDKHQDPKAKTRIYLVLELPCSPHVLVHRTTVHCKSQGREQGSQFCFLQFQSNHLVSFYKSADPQITIHLVSQGPLHPSAWKYQTTSCQSPCPTTR